MWTQHLLGRTCKPQNLVQGEIKRSHPIPRQLAVWEAYLIINLADTLMCIWLVVFKPVFNHSEKEGKMVLEPLLPANTNMNCELLDIVGIVI